MCINDILCVFNTVVPKYSYFFRRFFQEVKMSHARPLLLPEEAKKEIAKLMTSGFQHHSYLHEKVIIQTVLS